MMKNYKDIQFTQNGQEVFDKIVAVWPPIIRSMRKNRILEILSLLMHSRRIRKAEKDLVIEAARHVVPKSYDPLFHMFDDPEAFRKKMLDPFVDEKAYRRIPVRVRRWKHTRVKKAAPSVKKPRITAFCASPRKKGNTDLLIDEALRGAQQAGASTEKIMLNSLSVGYCIGCRKCKDPGFDKTCIIKDDMEHLYDKIIAADALIIGFPIYTGRECAQLSTFLDRWDGFERYMLRSSLEPGRRAMVIGTWGYPHIDTYDHVIENIISILNLHHVETVEALSACGFEGMLHGLDTNRKGVIAQHPRELQKACDAGFDLARRI